MASQARHHLVLLPGLDGTGHLFEPFLSVLPPSFEATVVRYPADRALSQHDLFACIRSVIPWGQPYVLVAESTAGPHALKFVAVQHEDIRAVVLCASFVTNPLAENRRPSPLGWATSMFSKSWLEQGPSSKVVRKHLLGADAPDVLVDRATQALRSLSAEVWNERRRMILEADARQELRSCEKPILYLQATEDQFVGESALAEILRLKPSVKVAAIRGPHAILQRNPRVAIETIRGFLDALPQSWSP